MSEEEKKPNIFQKINTISSELEGLTKDGRNPLGYKYVSHAQLTKALRPLLIKHGVVVIPVFGSTVITDLKDKKTEKIKGSMTTFQAQYKFVNMDNPEDYVVAVVVGQGADDGDKGAYKAATGAMKYAFFQIFQVETDDDPENEKGTKAAPVAPAASSRGFDF